MFRLLLFSLLLSFLHLQVKHLNSSAESTNQCPRATISYQILDQQHTITLSNSAPCISHLSSLFLSVLRLQSAHQSPTPIISSPATQFHPSLFLSPGIFRETLLWLPAVPYLLVLPLAQSDFNIHLAINGDNFPPLHLTSFSTHKHTTNSPIQFHPHFTSRDHEIRLQAMYGPVRCLESFPLHLDYCRSTNLKLPLIAVAHSSP